MNAMVQTIRDMGQIKLAIIAGVAIVMIGFFAFLTLRVSTPALSPLYSSLSLEDSGDIVTELENRGVRYEIRANGSQILVPSDMVARLRMSMAQEGLPSGGSIVGYEIFDTQDAMGTSNFVMNVNMLRALEGELSRTISSFKTVDSSRVHLVIPKRELFTRDRKEPTGSVWLKMKGGNDLSKQEIKAIRHLVATAVPGLKASKITIVDSRGRLLAKGVEDGEEAMADSSDAEEFRIAFERRIQNNLESLLARSLGDGKVKVQVTADIDFDRIVTNSETFDPEGQVARSVQSSEETERENEKDINDNVTVANQLPDAEGNEAGTLSQRELSRIEETTNFEISKVVENHIRETGTINKLSVAVLVDGTYELNEEDEREYLPRSEEELNQIATLVKSAVGIDEERGDTIEVVNMQFNIMEEFAFEEGPFDWIKEDLDNIIQTLVIGGVAILAILLIIRPLVNRAIESTGVADAAELEAEQAALAGPALTKRISRDGEEDEDEEDTINIDRVKGRVKSSTFRKISELIDKHPEETMTILRDWMNKE